MRTGLKQWIRAGTACVCMMALLCRGTTVCAADLNSMESQSSELKNELNSINGEILKISDQIAETEMNAEAVSAEMEQTREQLAIARKNEERQFEDMELRIKYIYENDAHSWLSMLLTAQSLADLVNKVDFIRTLNEYDRNMLKELQTLRENIEAEEQRMKEQQESYAAMEEELNVKKAELNEKAKVTSTDLNVLSARIQRVKEEKKAAEAAKAAEEAKKAAEAAKAAEEAKKAAEAAKAAEDAKKDAASATSGDQQSTTSKSPSSGNVTSGSQQSSGGGYVYPSGSGQLTPKKGVVYYNGHKETYYSQRVLPGYGLNIPGRHVASDGTVRDENGYLCLASEDYPKGTIVETSLGKGVVYDSGCASGIIDIYTDW